MSSKKLILYSYYRSSCSWRVRIALALKGIDYTYHAVNLMADGGQQHSEAYTKINPINFVPALQIDDDILIESLPIIEYIEETCPEPRLYPLNLIKRAKARGIAEVICSGIQPLQNLSVLTKLGEVSGSDLGDRAAWAKYWVETKFESLEKLLNTTSGKYCVGDDITIADVCLVPQVYNANRFGVDMTKFPGISRLVFNLQQIEAFQTSHPSQQPDCPPEMRNVK